MDLYRNELGKIEAKQWDGTAKGATPIIDWILQHGGSAGFRDELGTNWLRIQTLEGQMYASPGDYIIRSTKGGFYPKKPDIFEKTYEKVDD